MTLEPPNDAFANPLVVVEASRALGPWTRYTDQVVANIPDDVTVKFTGGTIDLDGVDVIHSEGSLDRLIAIPRGSSSSERLDKTRQFVSYLEQHGIGLVRTIFDAQATVNDSDHAETIRLLDESTTTFVVVDGTTVTPDPERTVVIPFADLADRFVGYPISEQVPGRVLAVAPDELGAAAAQLLKTSFVTRTPDLTVRVAGKANEDLSALVTTAILRTPDAITSRIEVLSDAALIEEVTAAELVVVTDVKMLVDLHLVMLILSFDRPVLVPVSPRMTALAAELGDGWVITYDGPITAAGLDAAIAAIRGANRSARSGVESRGLNSTGGHYFDVFRAAAKKAKEALATREF